MTPLPVTESLIRDRSTAESFARGQTYYQEGAVGAVVRRGNVVQAEVEGSEPLPYRVTLVFDDQGETTADCTCAYSYGGWCKHIVATLLSILHHPESIEVHKPLLELLGSLDRETLHALLLKLTENDPSFADRVEAQISLLAGTLSTTGDQAMDAPPALPAVPIVTAASVLRDLRSVLRSTGWGRGYDYWSVGSIVGGVDQALQQVWSLIEAGSGRSALPVLDAITEETWAAYEGLDDSDGEGIPLFSDIGAAWAEALLSPDVTGEERRTWGVKVESWQGELEDYGLEEGFDGAVQAAKQGWDDRRLVRVLRGEDTRERLWEGDEPPDWLANEALVRARLDILQRTGRQDEFLRLADTAALGVAYASMLVQLGRVDEAIAYGLEHLASTEDALALAQVLREHQDSQGALEIAEFGFGLEGAKAALANWTTEVAAALGETTRALAAAEIAVREVPTLDGYRRAQELAGDAWPAHRVTLLAHLRRLPGYMSGAVEILLDENLIKDAIAVVDRGASHTLLERVAEAAVPSHPEWVIKTSRREAEAIMDRGKSEYYSSAAHWLARARAAYRVAGREAEWQAYQAHLLILHSRKYRLVPLLKAL
jgi:uncharacterized Zn finger protein